MVTRTATVIREKQTADRTLPPMASADEAQVAEKSLDSAATIIQELTAADSLSRTAIVIRTSAIADCTSEQKNPKLVSPAFYVPKSPFSQRLIKIVYDSKLKMFIDRMSQVHINISLIEAIREMADMLSF